MTYDLPNFWCTFAQLQKPQVKDKNNFDFLMRMLARIGPVVPPTTFPEHALHTVAKKHSLLGSNASTADLEAQIFIVRLQYHKIWWTIFQGRGCVTPKPFKILHSDPQGVHYRIAVWGHWCPSRNMSSMSICVMPRLRQAWASNEADLHRGLLQYALGRARKNPKSRILESNILFLENILIRNHSGYVYIEFLVLHRYRWRIWIRPGP